MKLNADDIKIDSLTKAADIKKPENAQCGRNGLKLIKGDCNFDESEKIADVLRDLSKMPMFSANEKMANEVDYMKKSRIIIKKFQFFRT